MFSQEYIASIAVLLVSVLGLFKIQIENETITALITGILGVWIAIRRYQKKDINILGVRK
jgi:hypothetical protein